MGDAPVQAKTPGPTRPADVVQRWQLEGPEWYALYTESNGHPAFWPLTVKAGYVVCVIHDICQGVDLLLHDRKRWPITYLPAYGVFASGVELLGRCINGNDSTRNTVEDLKTGFRWLAPKPAQPADDNTGIIQTANHQYTAPMLAALRHFAADGQATSHKDKSGHYQYEFGAIEFDIMGDMPELLANNGEEEGRMRVDERTQGAD